MRKIINKIRSLSTVTLLKILLAIWILDYLVLAGSIVFISHEQQKMLIYQLHSDNALYTSYNNEIFLQKEINILEQQVASNSAKQK